MVLNCICFSLRRLHLPSLSSNAPNIPCPNVRHIASWLCPLSSARHPIVYRISLQMPLFPTGPGLNWRLQLRAVSRSALAVWLMGSSPHLHFLGLFESAGWVPSSRGRVRMKARVTAVSSRSRAASSLFLRAFLRLRRVGFPIVCVGSPLSKWASSMDSTSVGLWLPSTSSVLSPARLSPRPPGYPWG